MRQAALIVKSSSSYFVITLDKDLYQIGRRSSNDIFIDSVKISRIHATIYISNNSYWIIDGDRATGKTSTNGIRVNNEAVFSHKLNSFDFISFTDDVYALFVQLEDERETFSFVNNFIPALSLFFDGRCISNITSSNEQDDIDSTYTGSSSSRDDLTQLPKRALFLKKLEKALESSQQTSGNHKFSVIFIDVDKFKMINDSLGHEGGNKTLIEIADRIQSNLRDEDYLARLGGDEFAVLLESISEFDDALLVARRLQDTIAMPMTVCNKVIHPTASLGIASSNLAYQSPVEILRDADIAMYNAKSLGRGRFVVFDQKMRETAAELLKLKSDLERSIETNQLELYYQPIVSIKQKRLAGFEALIRWNHSEMGLISPDVFIPIAEESGMIYEIGTWILEESCSQLSRWKNSTIIRSDLSINVNVSSRQLSDSGLSKKLEFLLNKYDILPTDLKLEVTESIVMENSQNSIDVFNELKSIGVQLAIDDFGTGYSSLSFLHKFPIDTLKIDRSFISGSEFSSSESVGMSIASSIIALAHSLDISVTAEGVEVERHLQELEDMECDYAQGYLFARPLTAKEATDVAKNGLSWAWNSTR